MACLASSESKITEGLEMGKRLEKLSLLTGQTKTNKNPTSALRFKTLIFISVNKIKIFSGLSAGTVKDLSNLFHITFLIILIIVIINSWIICKRLSY